MNIQLPLTLDTMSPSELEMRRRQIVDSFTTQYNGYDDPNAPLSLLQELAFITQKLRRKNSGAPRAKKPTNGKSKPSLDDFMDL